MGSKGPEERTILGRNNDLASGWKAVAGKIGREASNGRANLRRWVAREQTQCATEALTLWRVAGREPQFQRGH